MNGLDLPLETASRNRIINEDFEVKQSSLKNNSHEDGCSVKMLINEMCNGESPKCGRPNVVARLMGMDTLLPKTGPAMEALECLDENSWKHTPKMSHCESIKSPLNYKLPFSIPPTKSSSSAKPNRREHPQEEQLQKFKKEFEAWQESNLWEFSSSLGHYSSEEVKNEQILSLENLKKEKMAAYMNTYLMPKIEDDMAISSEKVANSFEPASTAKFQEKRSTPCSPTRIVILKPGSDRKDEMKVPWRGSPGVVKKGSSMEDFLEEVKERLRLEMEGRGKNGSIRRLGVGQTSLHESSTNPKQQAREAAKHEAMRRRSQSLITCRSAFHFDEQESSKSIKRETKKFIYDRLKNVLKDDTEMKKPMLEDENFGKSLSVKETPISRSVTAFSKEEKDASFWEEKKAVNESIPKHLRDEQIKMVPLSDEAMSPSNFDGSFSASASESAFGNALSEHGQVATEDQNFQKPEASKNDSAAVKKRKKDVFSIKSTVSNLKQSLGLKGIFFGKKTSSMGESTVDTVHLVKPNENTVHLVKPNETSPLFIRNFGIVQENSTEVPPSPASFPCSPINEHHSPVSPFEDPFGDGPSSTQVSGELSMSLPEFGSKRCGMTTQTRLYESNETILTEDCGEAYVRDILVVSGLYRACWPLDQAISRLDGQVKPISSCVFYEVEEKWRKLRTVDDDYSTMSFGDINIDRKMLFDLVNEALPNVLDSSMTKLMEKRLSHHYLRQLPHGRKLLDDLLIQIQMHSKPKVEQPQSIDDIVVWDMKLKPLLTSVHEDISFLGREIEWVIMRELIDDLLSELLV